MRTLLLRLVSVVLLGVFSLTASGCYKWVDIKPAELPKLNGSYARVTGSVPTPSGVVTTVESTVAHVERPDGTLVEIKGRYDAEVTTSSGAPMRFEHPVNSTLEGDQLAVQASNRTTTAFKLQDVKSVQVSQYDATATTLAAVGASAVIGVLVYVLVTAAVRSSTSTSY
jgi:hypothetical protein